jgi:hypothetical protein
MFRSMEKLNNFLIYINALNMLFLIITGKHSYLIVPILGMCGGFVGAFVFNKLAHEEEIINKIKELEKEDKENDNSKRN